MSGYNLPGKAGGSSGLLLVSVLFFLLQTCTTYFLFHISITISIIEISVRAVPITALIMAFVVSLFLLLVVEAWLPTYAPWVPSLLELLTANCK